MKTKSKYRAQKMTYNGFKFDSKAEARRYQELDLLERAGKIESVILQPKYTLMEGYTNGAGRRIREMVYIADFAYKNLETGEYVIEDVKGVRTEGYKLKKKLFEKVWFPFVITEVNA